MIRLVSERRAVWGWSVGGACASGGMCEEIVEYYLIAGECGEPWY